MTFEDKMKRLMIIVNKGDLDEYGWHLVQLNEQESIKLHDSQMQKDMTDAEVVNIQLFQFRKCSPRFFDSLVKIGSKFPASFIVLLNHDMCVNAHLNLPNDEKYDFTNHDCLEWIKTRMD